MTDTQKNPMWLVIEDNLHHAITNSKPYMHYFEAGDADEALKKAVKSAANRRHTNATDTTLHNLFNDKTRWTVICGDYVASKEVTIETVIS